MLGAVLWPAVRGTDGFPLSNYPMFSRAKRQDAGIYHVVGYSSEGRHRAVSPEILGSDEIMQASQTAKLAFKRGPTDAQTLCGAAAQRVAIDVDYGDITKLQVRFDLYDAVKYWQGETKPKKTVVAAECRIDRTAW